MQFELAQKRPLLVISGTMILSTLIVHFPFYFQDISTIYRHYDGPFYMYIAKTFYIIPPDHPFHENIPETYYASFFPLYPVLIRLMTIFTQSNYPLAMILTTLSCSVAAAILFYVLLKEWQLVKSPLWTSILFCFIPERWLMQHSIGSTEPLLFCLIFCAFIAYRKRKHWLVFLCAFLACITRPPGFLLPVAFVLIYLRDGNFKMVFLMPLALLSLAVFFLYHHFVFGDFLASFHIHTKMAFVSSTTKQSSVDLWPLAIYRFYAKHPAFHSTQLFLILYVLNLIGTLGLWKRKELFIYSMVSFVFILFVFSYELPRYLLPIAPFALLVSFDEILTRRAFCFVVLPLFLYLAYTFVWGFLPLAMCSPKAMELMLLQLR